MEIFTSKEDQRDWSRQQRLDGKRIGFVPTMGALHPGHLSLIEHARKTCDVIVVSIYINPTQFDNPDDLEAYPRTAVQDVETCRAAGVDAVFTPDDAMMYRPGHASFVEVIGQINEVLCGMARPGHFRGVCTVVCKLFHIVEPDVAVFGQKDLQQALMLARMCAELDFGLRIDIAPTVREADGLAMSSRNRRLGDAQRAIAVALPVGLEKANRAFANGETDANALQTILATEILQHEGVDLDYVQIIDPITFNEQDEATDGSVLAAAMFIDGIRLIDHVALGREALPVTVED